MLIIGGEDRKTGHEENDPDRHAELERWGGERFPMIDAVEFRWSGQVMESIDGLAYIGHNPADNSNVYVATGDSGMGMTHGTIAALLISDLILGRENPWKDLYDPSRITLRAAGEFASEGADMVAQFADWVTGGEVESEEDIPAGSGAVLRRGLKKIAVYRSADGVLHRHSAACTHLGCVVAWNPVEKSWDCPCHGSRFDPYGRVLNGPAVRELERTDD
jgi:Rieske Fe-S protein